MKDISRFILGPIVMFSCAIVSAQIPGPAQPPANAVSSPVGQQPPPSPAPHPQPSLPGLTPDPLVMNVPGAEQSAAPDWIKPGTRLTFYSSSSVRNSDTGKPGIRRDPNGEIIDNQGNRWTLTDPNGHGQAPSSGGIGWTAIDVIASEPGMVLLLSTEYLLPNGFDQPATQTTSAPIAAHPSGCRFFMHPHLLAQVPPIHKDGITILQQQYQHNNQNFNALRVVATTAGYDMQVYDLASGVLLASSARISNSQGQVLDQHGNIHNSSSTVQGNYRFVGSRELALPWKNQRMPDWVRQSKRLRYQGMTASKMQDNSGLPDLPGQPVTADIVTQKVGENWSLHEITFQEVRNDGIPVIPSTSRTASGPASLMGVWMDPSALRGLQTGQVIDQDQVTGQQTMIEYAGPSQDGRPIVAITSATPIQKITNVYDADTGRLVQIIRVDSFPEVRATRTTTLNLAAAE